MELKLIWLRNSQELRIGDVELKEKVNNQNANASAADLSLPMFLLTYRLASEELVKPKIAWEKPSDWLLIANYHLKGIASFKCVVWILARRVRGVRIRTNPCSCNSNWSWHSEVCTRSCTTFAMLARTGHGIACSNAIRSANLDQI